MKRFRKYQTADLIDFTLVQTLGIAILSHKNFIYMQLPDKELYD